MPSQKSTPTAHASGSAPRPAPAPAPAAPVAPKRQRGRQRVAAILAAASDLFFEKGFDGATMTEIAARSDTAIGSLYRFFPTKESLADALLGHYLACLQARLDDIATRPATLGPAAFADALLDMAFDLRDERAAAVILIDARRDGPYQRATLRDMMRGRIGALLHRIAPTLPPGRGAAVATMMLQFLKAVPVLAEEERRTGAPLLAELRSAARLYASAALTADGTAP